MIALNKQEFSPVELRRQMGKPTDKRPHQGYGIRVLDVALLHWNMGWVPEAESTKSEPSLSQRFDACS